MTLAADVRLEQTGLLAHLVPRFALKTGIKVTVVAGQADDLAAAAAAADALVAPAAVVGGIHKGAGGPAPRPAFLSEDPSRGGAFAVLVVDGAAQATHAARFADWLTSEIGQRTVAQYTSPAGIRYRPGALALAEPEPAPPSGDADTGQKLAILHCGRCHVVSERNRFAGIGSTPSFAALRAIPDWLRKFQGFYAENPHPSFTQVEGVTDPFDPARPPHIAPVEITPEDLQAIVAYAASIPPKDLGPGVEAR
ncbi:hypothetical protein EJA01_15375 [Rhodovulum iodosum]|nr:cytochrome c [Rhodovulum robiginosum]RSK31512.1 hypothetical protein EJA01_15375 [Rhodovulum robiginosum]